jgi:hypothetical protein
MCHLSGGNRRIDEKGAQRASGQELMSALGHSRPSHFVPVLNNVRYASDSDQLLQRSEMSRWANSGHQNWPALLSAQQHRQLRDVRRNPSRFIAAEQFWLPFLHCLGPSGHSSLH